MSLGAKILCDHFALFTDLSDTMGDKSTVVEKAPDDKDKMLEMTIEELDLSVRSFNCLKRANINTVRDLISRTPEEMMKVRNICLLYTSALPSRRPPSSHCRSSRISTHPSSFSFLPSPFLLSSA